MKIGKFDKYYHPMISAATHSASAHESNHMEPAQSVCVARLLFYSKCSGFTVCLTYSDMSLTMYINQ